jgi:hypothetical protein
MSTRKRKENGGDLPPTKRAKRSGEEPMKRVTRSRYAPLYMLPPEVWLLVLESVPLADFIRFFIVFSGICQFTRNLTWEHSFIDLFVKRFDLIYNDGANPRQIRWTVPAELHWHERYMRRVQDRASALARITDEPESFYTGSYRSHRVDDIFEPLCDFMLEGCGRLTRMPAARRAVHYAEVIELIRDLPNTRETYKILVMWNESNCSRQFIMMLLDAFIEHYPLAFFRIHASLSMMMRIVSHPKLVLVPHGGLGDVLDVMNSYMELDPVNVLLDRFITPEV